MLLCCENFEKVGAEIRHLRPKKLSHFSALFSLSPTFLWVLRCVLWVFLYLLGSVNIMGDVYGSYFSFCTLCVFAFLGDLSVLAVFAHFLEFSGNLGVLRAIVSYKVTRWI